MIKKKLFESLKIELDKETGQYSIWNDLTPGVYGIGNTKQEAIKEYMSSLEDHVLSHYKLHNEESQTIA